MSTYLHDGITFDLGVPHLDVTGVEWRWIGVYTEAGEPLMQAMPGNSSPIPLPDVYAMHGPLIPAPRPTTAAMYRQVLEAS
ncbi:phiSA1p31-related protein [Streptomyces sp. AHA2]|uniref:phiSA1p31-related protein n=1 Tax=Streptomyces sp. AHA2 TaxID=3064526 RepID=UPI002FDF9002